MYIYTYTNIPTTSPSHIHSHLQWQVGYHQGRSHNCRHSQSGVVYVHSHFDPHPKSEGSERRNKGKNGWETINRVRMVVTETDSKSMSWLEPKLWEDTTKLFCTLYMHCPYLTFAVLSSLAEAICFPSWLKTTHLTSPEWPLYCVTRSPLSVHSYMQSDNHYMHTWLLHAQQIHSTVTVLMMA